MGMAKSIFIVLIYAFFVAFVYAFGTAEPLWEKELGGVVSDVEVSENYILVGAGDKVHLLDRKGNQVWDYPSWGNATVVAISEEEDYVVVASKNGYIHVVDINGSEIKTLYYQGSITGLDLGKPNQNITNALFPYPGKGHFLGLGSVIGSEGKPVFAYTVNWATGEPKIVGYESSISNYTDPCSASQLFMDRVSGWGLEISVGAGTEVGKLGLGRVNSHCSWGNYTIVSTTSEKLHQVTLFDFSRRENSVVWHLKPEKAVDKVVLFQNGSYVIANTGNKLAIYDNPSVEKPKPRLVVLANSIDYGLASDFFGFLQNNGIEATHATAADFDQHKGEKFIVILGGPDAPEGVGGIVQEVLTSEEQDWLRQAGNKKMQIKTNVWGQGQVVMVIAGSGRDETKQAHVEHRGGVENKING